MSSRDGLHKLIPHLTAIPRTKTVLCYMWLEASKSVLAIFYYLGPSNFLLAIVEKVAFARFSRIWCPETLPEGILSNHFQSCDRLGPDFWSPVILPGRLQTMGSLGVGHDWATSLALFTFMQRRKWQPTPVFLPGESQGRGSLLGCRLWGRTESDMTKAT